MKSENNNKKVFVALSGGVDSAVSAALLVDQGYDVTGVYMKNWSGDDFGIQDECPWEQDQSDAENVCKHLGIPFRSFNFEKQYRDKVVEYFFDEYKKGRTPNPDVMCNKEIKFKLFLERAIEEGADLIATGHYARKQEDRSQKSEVRSEDANYQLRIKNDELNPKSESLNSNEIQNSKPEAQSSSLVTQNSKLLTGVDDNKNQVYFLYNITQEQLQHVLFPIGHLTKPEVRKIAKEKKLPNADKPDSQGICFIGEINVLKFLMSRIPKNPGDIVDVETNEKVGEHEGIYFYTLGQRAKISGQLEPYYYCGKDKDKNIMFVCHGHENQRLFTKTVELENLHLVASNESRDLSEVMNQLLSKKLTAMVRYRQTPQLGKLEVTPLTRNSQLTTKFVFDESQWAVASGQSLVLFDGEVCLGGGIIQ